LDKVSVYEDIPCEDLKAIMPIWNNNVKVNNVVLQYSALDKSLPTPKTSAGKILALQILQ
jgi:hypothetical protein